jgi:hypothetical protein
MLLSEIYSRFRTFIVSVLDNNAITIIFANQNAPRPSKPFVTISIKSLRDTSMPILGQIDDLGLQNLLLCKSFLVTLEAYSDQLHESEEILNKIQNYLSTEIAYKAFQGDMAYLKTVLGVTAVPQAISGINESRAILELEFNFTQEVQDKVGLIEHIYITDLTTVYEIIINK